MEKIDMQQREHACKTQYKQILSDFLANGLDENLVREIEHKYIRQEGDEYILDPAVHLPTGLAIGMPLPLMLNITINKIISELRSIVKVATVPSEKLHITLINKTHFEYSSGKLSYFNYNDIQKAYEKIKECKPCQIKICFNGILVTKSGKIWICGYPKNGTFFYLRYILTKDGGWFASSDTAHLKIGHTVEITKGSYEKALQNFIEENQNLFLGEFKFNQLRSTYCGEIPLI